MAGQWVLDGGVRRPSKRRDVHLHVVKVRPEANHQDPFATSYRSPVGDGGKRESWADYLRRMTDRPGWSVAKLARESGIHRATIFKWMASKGGANVASARAIGDALGDTDNALRAAGNMGGETEQMDPDLQVILQRLTDPTVSDAEKDAIRTALKYLAEVAERTDAENRPGRVVRRRKAG